VPFVDGLGSVVKVKGQPSSMAPDPFAWV